MIGSEKKRRHGVNEKTKDGENEKVGWGGEKVGQGGQGRG